MYLSKTSTIASEKFLPKRFASHIIPLIVAALYGALVFKACVFTSVFFSCISASDTLFLIALVSSVFAAICLSPVLIRLGNGATISELRLLLKNSQESVRVLKNKETQLNHDLKGYENELSRSYRYFRHVLKTFNMATFHSDMNHRIKWAHNFSYDKADIVGKKVTEIIPTVAGDKLASLMQEAIDDGDIHEDEIEIVINNQVRHYAVQVAPHYDREGNVVGSLCVSNDVTEKSMWHQHLATMTLEVNHRARNLLAIVVSMLGQTAKTVTSVSEYKSKILTRVTSLSKSINLITQDSWTASSLNKLVTIQIDHAAPGLASQIKIEGADVGLKSKAIQNIGLAINELTTNSKKFGALSAPEGSVLISWNVTEENSEQQLCLRWNETWKHACSTPPQKGFGLTILEKIVAQELGGESRFTWHNSGVDFEMTIPGEWLDVH